jgi:site-specific recombinase XerD
VKSKDRRYRSGSTINASSQCTPRAARSLDTILLTARAIQYIVAGYMKGVYIKGASVHTLRHTMATHHVAHGTDLKTIEETLGHASESDKDYLQLAEKAQKKALQEHAL